MMRQQDKKDRWVVVGLSQNRKIIADRDQMDIDTAIRPSFWEIQVGPKSRRN